MELEKIIKIIGLNIGIALVNIIIFSPGILGLTLKGEDSLKVAIGITVLVMSIIIFIVGNYKLLAVQSTVYKATEIKTMEECVEALEHNRRKHTFMSQINMTLEQMNRLRKKEEMIYEVLSQRFSVTEMSYSKFENVLKEIEHLMLMNIRSMVNRLNAFDEQEYVQLTKMDPKKIDKKVYSSKMQIYEEYISFINEAITDNEEILLKLDQLLLELSKLNSLEEGELENMPAMTELDALISRTKLYKE